MDDTKPTALVVDDDPDAAAVMQLLLARWGCRSAIAPDGEAALRLAAQAPPRLVFVDLHLGDHDGVEVLHALRDALPPQPRATIVCLTGRSEATVRQRCLRAGFDAFFTKPMPLDALAALAREAA